MPLSELSERQRRILFFIVDAYIQRGDAIASSSVAREAQLDVSSATIRSVMGDLEAMGLLMQPHTSAGRVPTAQGLRHYVDELTQQMKQPDLRTLDLVIGDEDLESAAQRAGVLLSQASNLAGLVLGPQISQVRLRDLKLVSISDTRVLAVLVTDDGRVLERMCALDAPMDLILLQQVQNYLVELVAGRTLEQLRERVRDELREARAARKVFESSALAVGEQVLQRTDESRLKVEGLLRFLDFSEFKSDVDRLREVVRIVEERERLEEILDRLGEPRGPVAVIGPEMGESDWARELGLVVCSFYQGTEPVGLVGVLGPMRMDYGRMIPLVDRVARVLSRAPEDDSNKN
jgi:heat-inducible transcriptional repressor